MIYLVAWAFGYLMLGAATRWPRHGKLFCLLAVLVMGGLATLRGSVGTDTVDYERLSLIIRGQGIWTAGVEPGFAFLFLAFQAIGLTDVLVVRAVAIIDILLLLTYIWWSTEDERYFLLAVFLPSFFYMDTMNAIRIGLVSIGFLLIFQWISRRKSLRWYHGLPMAGALLFHYTAIFYSLFTYAAVKTWSRKLIVLCSLSIVSSMVVVMLLSPDHLAEKIRLYAAYPAPSWFSGLSSVVKLSIMMFAVYHSSLSAAFKKRMIGGSLVLMLVFLAIVQVSYAGLRLLDLLVYSMVVVILCMHGMVGERLNRMVKLSMLIFGLISVFFIFRNFLNESAHWYSPFLPYHTFLS